VEAHTDPTRPAALADAKTLPRVCLVRHGETAWTISGQHTGRSDIPLTIRGEDQARSLRVRLRRMAFALVLTSPLGRARRTCSLAGFGAEAEIVDDLKEWDYGAYEGRRTSEILAERPAWRLFDDGCPGGESVDAVAARADRVIARIRQSAGNVLLFAHRDILRACAARWLGLPARDGRLLYLDTGSMSMLGYGHHLHDPVIRLWNEVPE
jgi:probable phosphoglycerate mutase